MRPFTLSLLTLTLSLGTLSAQTDQYPNFAGRWTTEPEQAAGSRGGAATQGGRGAARGDMGSGWGPTITITQDASKLTVEYAFFGRGDMQPPLRFVYALDNSVSRNTVMMGRGNEEQLSTVTRDGSKLTIITKQLEQLYIDGKPIMTEVRRTLSLESPTSLVMEIRREGILGAAATTSKVTYRKL